MALNFNRFGMHLKVLISIVIAILSAHPIAAKVKLPPVLSSGMVVQRNKPFRLWGTADGGESVVVTVSNADNMAEQRGSTTADKDGKWMIELQPLETGTPYVITVNDAVLDNVVAGDVYLCSGQSNMELPVRRVTDKFADEIKSYSNDRIRVFRVPLEYEFHTPLKELNGGEWKSTTLDNVMDFSALGYFFAKALYSQTNVPVGIINSSWGGTPIEAWMSEQSLEQTCPRAILEKRIYENDAYRENIKRLEGENFKRWNDALFSGDAGLNDAEKWYGETFDDSDWETVDITKDSAWATDGLNAINGSHWFRKKFSLTAAQASLPAVLRLGCIVDADSVYVNGRFVGSTSYQYPPRIYHVAADILHEGENSITVRLISQNDIGGFVPEKPYKLITNDGEINLDGEWRYHIGAQMPNGPGMEFFHYKPTVLFNSMIHPLANLSLSGVVWYQGESNVSRRNEYGNLLKTMIGDWRSKFNSPNLPFYIIELADFLNPSDIEGRRAWAEMRAAQAEAAHNTARVTLIKNQDLGEWNDIHPLDKKTLGQRIAEAVTAGNAYDGRRLWLPERTEKDRNVVECDVETPTASIAMTELNDAWEGDERIILKLTGDGSLGRDGYIIRPDDKKIVIMAANDLGLLYGAYHLLRNQSIGKKTSQELRETPAYDLRILNHWDNLDGTVERGYGGRSIWKWDELPDSVSPRYREYARANASIGINGVVINNVNASSKILTTSYLGKVAAIADVFRPYGITVFLSANFAAPMQLDSLPTADPLDARVTKWWSDKCAEICELIPDFGGFLVKANSEGQPGPCDFGRTHSEGANMLARALKPYGGRVMWRAFVYSPSDDDRAKQAYLEFKPLDGQFDDNVIIQIKNGPIDFQPREPFSPLFGAMPSTNQMAELQITQEYLGQSNHLAFLANAWEEFFSQIEPSKLSAVAGVANIGDDSNWTGHPLAQANWYAFGRMAWNPQLTAENIAREWLPMSLYKAGTMPQEVENGLVEMMLASREAVVDYMMPLGLHHIFAFGHHYGPEPWCEREGARPDWLPTYYHRADSSGIGFDRTSSGSNATAQYPTRYHESYNDPNSCPENLLLWFHHLPWTFRMKSGATLWDELCRHYHHGCQTVGKMQDAWNSARPYLNPELHYDVEKRLNTQARDAEWWKDACLLYFGEFAKLPWPEDVTPPTHSLDKLKTINLGITNFESPSAALLDSLR